MFNTYVMHPLRTATLSCLLIAIISLAAAGQNPKSASEDSARVLSLESIWNAAEVAHDARALSLLLADAFEYTDDDGSFLNREEWLKHVAGEVDQYEQLGDSEVAVHLYGNVAIVVGQYREKLKIKGRSVVRTGRFTDTWVRQNGQWKCAASQSTLIGP